MTPIGLLIAVVAFAAIARRLPWPYALALGGATPAGAALILGDTVLPTFYAVALTLLGVVMLATMFEVRPRPARRIPGLTLLGVFLAWSVLVTLTAPLMFDGMAVVHPEMFALSAGTITPSNIAQLAYLILGILVFAVVAHDPAKPFVVLGIAVAAPLLLSLWRHLSLQIGLPFPEGFFDNSPGFNYIETDSDGSDRVRGILSEPSALATVCVVAATYFGVLARQVPGVRRVGCIALAASAVYLGSISTSATFVIAGVTVLGLFLFYELVRFIARRSTAGYGLGVALAGAVVAAAVVAPGALAFVESTVDAKLDTGSFTARSGTDTASFGIFLDTYGWGVGLGAARASSFVPTLLSAVGLIGSLLFVGAVVSIVIAARRDRTMAPVMWLLVAFFVVKVVSSPDLSDSSGVMWLSLGVLGRAAMRSRKPDVPMEPSWSGAVAGPPLATRDQGGQFPPET